MKITVIASLFGVLLLLSPKVSAVTVSPSGSGEAIIIPYFTTNGGNSSLLSVVNERSVPQAVKLILRNELGEAVLHFNAYIEQYGSLVMALSESNGLTELTIPDQTCILPAQEEMNFTALSETRTGFAEVISMGAFDETVGTVFRTAAIRQECDVLESAWQSDGAWISNPAEELLPPASGLRGSASVINVTRGTQYAIPTTALMDFSDIIQHTPPTSDKPDLTSAHGPGTPVDATESMNCFASASGCISTEWASPLDAVAAALIAEAGTGEFSIEDEVGAKAEVVVMFPLRRHYIKRIEEREGSEEGEPFPGDALAFADIGVSIFDREGESIHNEPGCPPVAGLPGPPWCGDAYRRSRVTTNDPAAVSVFSFNAEVADYGEIIETPILGEMSEVFFPSTFLPTIPPSGSALFVMLNFDRQSRLTSNSGERFGGFPFIAFMIQEVRNGTLVDEATGQRVRANYGTSFQLNFTEPDFLRRQNARF